MGRSPCCAKEGLNRGAWTAMEDKILKDYIQIHGDGKWRSLPKKAGENFTIFWYNLMEICEDNWLNFLQVSRDVARVAG